MPYHTISKHLLVLLTTKMEQCIQRLLVYML
nr:MAG TPA: hypothetical protein [Caudoviricetes sp.]